MNIVFYLAGTEAFSLVLGTEECRENIVFYHPGTSDNLELMLQTVEFSFIGCWRQVSWSWLPKSGLSITCWDCIDGLANLA